MAKNCVGVNIEQFERLVEHQPQQRKKIIDEIRRRNWVGQFTWDFARNADEEESAAQFFERVYPEVIHNMQPHNQRHR